MKVLELFSGTESFSTVARSLGLSTFTSDIDEDFNPDYAIDIMYFDPKRLPFKPTVIWASPPCESFSVASIGKHWNRDHTPKTAQATQALLMIERVVDIIGNLKPERWYIENPRGKMRKVLPNLLDTKIGNFWIMRTVSYCQYGDTRMKPTDIFTNDFNWIPRTICKNGMPCHESAPRGARTGTQGIKTYKDRSRVPSELAMEILTAPKESV